MNSRLLPAALIGIAAFAAADFVRTLAGPMFSPDAEVAAEHGSPSAPTRRPADTAATEATATDAAEADGDVAAADSSVPDSSVPDSSVPESSVTDASVAEVAAEEPPISVQAAPALEAVVPDEKIADAVGEAAAGEDAALATSPSVSIQGPVASSDSSGVADEGARPAAVGRDGDEQPAPAATSTASVAPIAPLEGPSDATPVADAAPASPPVTDPVVAPLVVPAVAQAAGPAAVPTAELIPPSIGAPDRPLHALPIAVAGDELAAGDKGAGTGIVDAAVSLKAAATETSAAADTLPLAEPVVTFVAPAPGLEKSPLDGVVAATVEN